jgi:DNA polymerase-1
VESLIASTTFGTKCDLAKFGAELVLNPATIDTTPDIWFVDCEWNSKTNKLVGVGFASDDKRIFYCHGYPNNTLIQLLTTKTLVFHNALEDLRILELNGIKVDLAKVYDTMLMSYLVDTRRKKHGLKHLALEFWGAKWATFKEMVMVPKTEMVMVGKKRPQLRAVTSYTFRELDELPEIETANYCCCDVLHTAKLFSRLKPEMHKNNWAILKEIDLPTALVIQEMETVGIKTDQVKLAELKAYFAKLAVPLERDLKQAMGADINLASPKQVLTALRALVHKSINATNEKVLKEHKNHPLVAKLFAYRELRKLQSTYVEALEGKEVVCAGFSQTGTVTTRLASSNPNLQNIPSRSELGMMIRGVFVAREGKELYNADYSNADLRMIAHFMGNGNLFKAFMAGQSPHDLTAQQLAVDRQSAKVCNLILANSGGPGRFVDLLEVPIEEGKRLHALLRDKYAAEFAWMDAVCKSARVNGGIRTIAGRFIPCPYDVWDEDARAYVRPRNKWDHLQWCRDTISKKVQGSTADMAKLAMIDCYRAGLRPVLVQEHDALVIERPNQPDWSEEIKKTMEHVFSARGVFCRVPIVVEVKRGHTWRGAKGK